MAKSVSTSQRGFTLIEMSIVLVIIGLIIGGILKGQELIESSRQKNLMSQIDRLKSSTTTFVDRYRALPGDFDRATLLPRGNGIASGGNNDGVVGPLGVSAVADLITLTNAILNTTENVQYFNQLLAAEMAGNGSVVASGLTIACFSGMCATPSPLPGSAFPSSGLTIHYGTHQGGTGGGGAAVPKQAHWFVLSRYDTGTLTAADAVLSAGRAYQIDSKYDDGSAGAGNVRSGFIGNGCGGTGADYTASVTDNECILLFTLE